MVTITKTIDVDIEDFTDEELLAEVEYRGLELVKDYKSYDLDLVPTLDLISILRSYGYTVIDDDLVSDNILDYIISILPETKIGSEEFMIQDSIRRLRRMPNDF